ncbi:MAG TPA: RNA 2',3'-cyclic phosphodiesterase [Solirubrobacteraceae bacterium]
MAAEPRSRAAGAESARLFVALELPDTVRDAVTDWSRRRLAGLPTLRFVPAGALHVTLCFLGSRPASEAGEIVAACRVVAGWPALGLALGEPVWLPRRRPRVLAISVVDETVGMLARLQSALAAALGAGGFYAPDTRPFLGHVTVARVSSDARVAPVALRAPDAQRFEAGRVTLYRSWLGSGPARYEALETVVLAGAD